MSENLALATKTTFGHIREKFGIEDGASVAGTTSDTIEAYKASLSHRWGWDVTTVLGIRFARLHDTHDYVQGPHVSAQLGRLLFRAPVVLARYGFWLL